MEHNSPSPQPPSSQHTYQTSPSDCGGDSSDHSLLGHSHQCLCPTHLHNLNVINQLSHGPTCGGSAPGGGVVVLGGPPGGAPSPVVVGGYHEQQHRASIHAAPLPPTPNQHEPKNQQIAQRSNNILQQSTKHNNSNNTSGGIGVGITMASPQQCTCCHLIQQQYQQSMQAETEIHEANIIQNRKIISDGDDNIEISPLPPALPPRPPPRQRLCGVGGDPTGGMIGGGHHLHGHGTLGGHGGSSLLGVNTRRLRDGGSSSHHHHNGIKKYVFWCCACGGLSTIIGALFLAVYFMLRSYTSTLTYFETIPTFVPATMLMLTGLCVMSLARRRNRFSYLIKVSGICCLVCALTCVLVTITTTVIHMNRLQTLRECVYTQKTRTCTCYSVLLEAHAETDEGTRFVFDSTPDCEVIHGALYSCLRAMFGLSVSGILVCIFSCMLVYQLLSHERKKMYWEQLELRCRSLYQHQTNSGVNSGSVRGPPVSLSTGSGFCSCCEECRYTPIPANPHLYPWDTHALDRFWTPGRIGNFYSPNPGEEMGPNTNMSGLQTEGNGSIRARNNNSGWNWRRLPWSRGGGACPDSTRASGVNFNYPTTISSPDSQYGFSSVPAGLASGPVSSSLPGSGVESITATTGSGGYTVLADRHPPGAYLWGPPPPYSNPDSPARRGIITSASPATRYHHSHHLHHAHAHCQLNDEQNQQQTECQHQQQQRPRSRPGPISKDNYENTTESEHGHNGHHLQSESAENTDNSSSGISNTLPVRKTKKRMDISSVKSVNQQNFRTNIQNIFQTQQNFDESSEHHSDEHNYQEPNQINKDTNSPSTDMTQKCRFLPRLQGVENPAFQTQETTTQPNKPQEPTESEVYFADVSSCCNISVRNDGHDSSLYDEALNQKMNQSFSNAGGGAPPNVDDEDYLAHRMGKRQMSTRSRLPFPLPNSDEHCKELAADQCLQQLLPKDLSQNSLISNCSNAQTPLTDTTDDALTPSVSSQKLPQTPTECHHLHPGMMKFSTSNENLDDQFLAPDAQYEVIAQTTSASSNLTTTISGLNNFTTQNCFGNHFSPKSNNVPPKSINCSNSKTSSTSPRKSIGSNISTLIQNLGGNPVGLLYGEVNSVEDDDEIQTQLGGNHSDVTMDSGWQSGSDRPDCIRGGSSGNGNNNGVDSSEETAPRSVNV